MSKAYRNTIAGSIGLAAMGLAHGAAAQGKEIRYATSSPPNTVWAMQAERFAKAAADASGGKLKVNVFLNSQLGSEQDTIQQIARGRIDMGGYSVTAGSLLVPELALMNLPFLFASQKQQDCVFDNHMTKLATASFAKKGVEFLGWTHVGQTNLIGKKPYEKPDDLKGLKARAQPTKIGGYLWTAFGANPNPLPVTEWNSAHQTGLVDVADAPLTFYVFAGLAKVAPVMTRTNHLDHGGVTVMNKAVYDAMSADEKKAVEAARAVSPAAQLRAEVRGFEKKVEAKFKAEGGTTVELDAAKRDAWRKGMEATWPKAVEAIGGESAAYWKAIQDGLKACAP